MKLTRYLRFCFSLLATLMLAQAIAGSNQAIPVEAEPITGLISAGHDLRDAMIAASDGYIYGLNRAGGRFDRGNIFRFNPAQNHRYEIVADIPANYSVAKAAPILANDGKIYVLLTQFTDTPPQLMQLTPGSKVDSKLIELSQTSDLKSVTSYLSSWLAAGQDHLYGLDSDGKQLLQINLNKTASITAFARPDSLLPCQDYPEPEPASGKKLSLLDTLDTLSNWLIPSALAYQPVMVYCQYSSTALKLGHDQTVYGVLNLHALNSGKNQTKGDSSVLYRFKLTNPSQLELVQKIQGEAILDFSVADNGELVVLSAAHLYRMHAKSNQQLSRIKIANGKQRTAGKILAHQASRHLIVTNCDKLLLLDLTQPAMQFHELLQLDNSACKVELLASGQSEYLGLYQATNTNLADRQNAAYSARFFKLSLSSTPHIDWLADQHKLSKNTEQRLILSREAKAYASLNSGGTNGAGTVYEVIPTEQKIHAIKHLPRALSLSTQFSLLEDKHSSYGYIQNCDDSATRFQLANGTPDYATIFGSARSLLKEYYRIYDVCHLIPYQQAFGLTSPQPIWQVVQSQGLSTRFIVGRPNSEAKFGRLHLVDQAHSYDFSAIVGIDPNPVLLGVPKTNPNRPAEFYGSTKRGGLYGMGTLYRYQAGEQAKALFHFDNDTGSPHPTNLLLANDGYIYGTTTKTKNLYPDSDSRPDSTTHCGILFRFKPDWSEEFQILHRFNEVACDYQSMLYPAASDSFWFATVDHGTQRGELFEVKTGLWPKLKLHDNFAIQGKKFQLLFTKNQRSSNSGHLLLTVSDEAGVKIYTIKPDKDKKLVSDLTTEIPDIRSAFQVGPGNKLYAHNGITIYTYTPGADYFKSYRTSRSNLNHVFWLSEREMYAVSSGSISQGPLGELYHYHGQLFRIRLPLD